MPMSTSIVPIGIVIQWCMTDVLFHKRHPLVSLILTMMANHHHLSSPLFKVSNDFVCSALELAVAIFWIQLLVVPASCLFEALEMDRLPIALCRGPLN